MQNHSLSYPVSRSLESSPSRSNPPEWNALHSRSSSSNAQTPGLAQLGSRITALNVEFVAKPDEAHKIHSALPAAIDSALGEVGGFAGSFVMIANYEARLVTVVTLWSGEDRMQRCSENLRWVRALLAPYLDRCLRVQTLAAYAPAAAMAPREFEASGSKGAMQSGLNEEAA